MHAKLGLNAKTRTWYIVTSFWAPLSISRPTHLLWPISADTINAVRPSCVGINIKEMALMHKEMADVLHQEKLSDKCDARDLEN